MNVLDFGSGETGDTLEFWTVFGGVEMLQKITGKKVAELTLHAFDPLEIDHKHSVSREGIDFHFHTSLETIPDNLDIVCGIYPNPIVAVSVPGFPVDNWEFHHRRYTPFLIDILREKLSLYGVCVLQFDFEWRALYGPVGDIQYIESLILYTSRRSSQLQEIGISEKDARFFNPSYTFESIALLRKVPKNLQNPHPHL